MQAVRCRESVCLTATANASCVLQDLPEIGSPGEPPDSLQMMVEGSLVYSIPPGTEVRVTAVYNVVKVGLHLRAALLCCKCWYSMCKDLLQCLQRTIEISETMLQITSSHAGHS